MSRSITTVLQQLTEAREGLWDYADEMLKIIDLRNPRERRNGSAFLAKVAELDELCVQIAAMVETDANTQAGSENVFVADMQPNSATIHTLAEPSFYGRQVREFVFRDHTYPDVKSWREMVRLLSQQLIELDAARFAALADSRDFVTAYGRRYVARAQDQAEAWTLYHQRCPEAIMDGIWIDLGEDANKLCDIMRGMLVAFDIDPHEVHIYLWDTRT